MGKFDSSVTFDGGFIPILKAFEKSSLETLSVAYFRDVNIQVVFQLCPNLQIMTSLTILIISLQNSI
jgi:hypothetical protein